MYHKRAAYVSPKQHHQLFVHTIKGNEAKSYWINEIDNCKVYLIYTPVLKFFLLNACLNDSLYLLIIATTQLILIILKATAILDWPNSIFFITSPYP